MKEILIKLRQENRYSQSLLAKILGISRQAYIKYELGEVEPSVEIVRKLSKIYNVPYDVLIDNAVVPYKKIEYKIPTEPTLEVASPTTVYSSSYNDSDTDNTIEYFKNQLDYLQSVIIEMKNKLNKIQIHDSNSLTLENYSSYSKSKSFNKDDFFNKVGKQNIDSSYITELREKSST
jgi:transcriptional regulator with XRE-family HTH domain